MERTGSGVVVAAVLATLMAATVTAHAQAPQTAPRAPDRCDRALPFAGRAQGFRRFINRLTLNPRAPWHRGHDVFVREGEPQWATATFAYDVGDARMEGEDVDVYLLRDCARWEPLGTVRTSRRGEPTRAADGGTSREGGRVAVQIPDARRLGLGMHRVRFVVRADHSVADAYLDVVPAGSRFVVSDVDGTLTDAEYANLHYLLRLRANPPGANPGAAETLRALAAQGYRVMYLTGRPTFVNADTHAWLAAHGFPPGVLRTRSGTTLGLGGPDTAQFKARELRATSALFGRLPGYAFGNSVVDVAAYAAAGVVPAQRYFYRFDDPRNGGQRLADYRVLAAALRAPAATPAIPAATSATTAAAVFVAPPTRPAAVVAAQ